MVAANTRQDVTNVEDTVKWALPSGACACVKSQRAWRKRAATCVFVGVGTNGTVVGVGMCGMRAWSVGGGRHGVDSNRAQKSCARRTHVLTAAV